MVYRLWPFVIAAMVTLAQTPVKLESRVDSKGSGEAVVVNLNSVPLTAYLLQVFLEPCSPSPRPAVFRAFDAALIGDSLPQFASRTENLGASFCNKDGVTVPGTAELRAAIFQDGSSFGEVQWVNSLLNNRRFQLKQFEVVLDRLKARDAGKMALEAVTEDLKNRLAVTGKQNRSPFPPLLDVSELASANLKTGIASTISLFERLRARLLEARPAR